jgi:hypothetical protein
MKFVYHGSSLLTWDNDCNKEIKRRIARTTGAMEGFKTIWKSKHISTETKISILRTCLFECAAVCLRDMDTSEKG